MMGLIGQGCEHGDVLEVTGTNTPTQKTPSVFFTCVGDKSSKIGCAKSMCLPQKKKSIVFVFVVQCLTQHATRTPLDGVRGVVVSGLCWWF